MDRLRILNVANKALPDSDYRIAYRRSSRFAEVTYGLPGKPSSLRPDEFVQLAFEEGLGPRDIECFAKLYKYLRTHRHNYDLVHFFSTKLQLFGPWCAALAGVPCVNTITGYGRTFNRDEFRYRLLRPAYITLMRMSLHFTRAAFFQNRGDLQWLVEQFPSLAHKFHWVGSGVDAEVAFEKDFNTDPLVVLLVARLMPDKGIPIFLEAAQQLYGGVFRFVLVGPKSIGQDSLYRQVLGYHERGIIDYRGELGTNELAALYRQSHLFAFPSRGEGMARVMLEAGHALLCPIASDIPANRDLIDDSGGFILTRGEEASSLVSHLQRLAGQRAELQRNARDYQRHIIDNYSLAAYTRRMDELITNVFLPQQFEPCLQR